MGLGRQGVAGVAGVTLAAPVYAAVAAFGARPAVAGVLAAFAAGAVVAILARRLPAQLDDLARRHRAIAIAWLALSLLGAGNLVRVAHFAVDGNAPAFSTTPHDGFYVHHSCLSAYYKAALLERAGVANLYEPENYHGRDEDPPEASMIGPFEIDLYEYPPPALVPARAALAVSDDFMAWRAGWFALETLLLIAALVGLAWWIGGDVGLRVGLAAPAVLYAVPTLLTLQIGNFQLAAYALALLGLIAVERERPALGGALLAAVTVTKVFPGLFLVYLLARRRWRAAIAMCVASVLAVALTVAVVGLDPFRAFVSFQLPRMADGSAFPWLQGFLPAIAVNHSIFGIVVKLHALGVPGMSFGTASLVAWVYTALAVGVAWVLGRRAAPSRWHDVLVWLGLLQLAALRSPFTPDVYAVFGPIWIAAMLGARAHGRGVAVLAAAWLALSAGVAWLAPMQAMGDDLRLVLTGAVQLCGFVLTYVALTRR